MATYPTSTGPESVKRRVRLAAFLLIVALLAGPLGTHVYWMLGAYQLPSSLTNVLR
jgi:hypothetical protein